MTVITNPYTKDAIKSAIAQARQTNTSPSRSTKTLFPIEVQLDELRDELVQFTVKNHLYVTSPGRLGEQYTNLLDDFLEEHESEGVTYEQLNDLLDDAYKEGIRQRALKEDARCRALTELTYTQVCSYICVHPEITFNDLMTSSRIFFRDTLRRGANLSAAQVEEFFRCALAGHSFVYPAEQQKEKPPSILDAFDAQSATAALDNTPFSATPFVKETTSPEAPSETPIATVVPSEPSLTVKKTRAPKRYNPEHIEKEEYKGTIVHFLNTPAIRQQTGYTPEQIHTQMTVPRSLRTIQRYLDELYEEGSIKLWVKDRGFGEKHRAQFWYSSILNRNTDFVLRCRLTS